jgi:TolB protein
VHADGSGEQEFASPAYRSTNDLWPVWSPDGRRIAFIRADAGSSVAYLQLFVMNADGSGQVGLPHPQIDYLPPRWSPDGSRILVGTVDKTISSFVLVDSHGQEPPIFLSALGNVRGATWERLNP